MRVQVNRPSCSASTRTVSDEEKPQQVDRLLETVGLADALASDRFKQFLDHVPIAIAVSETRRDERVVYVNLEFERLCGLSATEVVNRSWDVLAQTKGGNAKQTLSEAIAQFSCGRLLH